MKLMPEQPTEEMIESVRNSIANDYTTRTLLLDLYAAAPNIEPTIRTDNSAVIANMQKQIDGLKREKAELFKDLTEVIHSLQFANDTPNGGISDTLWMMHSNETIFDAIDRMLEKLKDNV